MLDLSGDAFNWIKALHIMAVLAWMAGLFYLPRLFVYHADAEKGSELSETLKVMERRLLRAIMNPAMIASWLFGVILLLERDAWDEGWVHAKLLGVVGMTVMHMLMARWRKDFLNDANTRSHKFYRVANEVPTVLMILIVIMAVVEPF